MQEVEPNRRTSRIPGPRSPFARDFCPNRLTSGVRTCIIKKYAQGYRSGHNEAVPETCGSNTPRPAESPEKARKTAENRENDGFESAVCRLSNGFSNVFPKQASPPTNTQGYRSGHNEAVLKTCGSKPLSASKHPEKARKTAENRENDGFESAVCRLSNGVSNDLEKC